ncbi:MAG: arginine--tRNA ligase [Alphaproteobacteria bacterium HGW-Alphaproteobacteria-12]|nr:MAG: arginine--tRNA ligase [Alphaproteobacteria bacterium HGW-Alphaproteobacteria-12]
MNIFRFFEGCVETAVNGLVADGYLPPGLDLARVAVEPPRDPSHGDLSSNAAMVLAKPAGVKPRDLAERLAAKLGTEDAVSEISIAGPGFINLRLTPAFWQARIPEMLRLESAYGTSTMGEGEAVNVEFVSANPTGPMHVGHVRGAVFGDALANLLEKTGYRVCREYYINDAGGQIEVLARSAFLRYREALGEDIGAIPDGLYPGDYLKPVGEALVAAHGKSLLELGDEAEALAIARAAAVEAMMELIRGDLAVLGIVHETFFSELSLHKSGAVEATLKTLEDKGLIYIGTLDPPKGMEPGDWEARPQTLFRSTRFGDDTDRALKKSDGSWTYFAPDIAYHLDKYRRGYHTLIDVWGADHSGYIKRMKAAIAGVTDGKAAFDVKVCQMVRLFRDGEPVRMSKRSGDFVTLREVVDEVGKDAVRFMMLTRKNDAPLDFDFARVMEQSRDNPVFYVQYAHARIRSVLRKAQEEGSYDLSGAALANADISRLGDEAEMTLLKLMAGFPRQVEQAAIAHEPHRIAFYLDDLAGAFHALWNKGKDDASLRFIVAEDRDVTLARFALIRAAAHVIAAGLAILGVEPAEEMR